MNRWLGRPPKTADEVRRLQACCDSETQCANCPFRAKNANRSLKDILREGLL